MSIPPKIRTVRGRSRADNPDEDSADVRRALLEGKPFELAEHFRENIHPNNTNELTRKNSVLSPSSETAPVKARKEPGSEDEGNVSSESKQKKTPEKAKRDLGILEAARSLLAPASPMARALVAGMILSEANAVHDLDALSWPPFPKLSEKQIAAAITHGKKRAWNARREFGYEWQTNVFEFVKNEYAPWIPGLTHLHLKSADLPLYRFFTRTASLDGLPGWLDVPSEAAAELRQIDDPVERLVKLVAREVERLRLQASRGGPK
jgi:hypothetical protein